MADNDSSQEKTEEPTSKRLEDTKKKGQAPRSRDFSSMVILIVAGVFLMINGPQMGQSLLDIMRECFSFSQAIMQDENTVFAFARQMAMAAIIMMIPFVLTMVFCALFGNILVGGWVFSVSNWVPKLEKVSPLKGIKRMFSLNALMELFKAILKVTLVGIISAITFYHFFPKYISLLNLQPQEGIKEGLSFIVIDFIIVSCALIVISAIDAPFQLWQHMEKLKMTKQEVKDEYKETEGKPEVKSKIRRQQQEIANRKMMADVPKADVILTNPTHYSVALVYEDDTGRAPIVIAKGENFMALQITKIAKGNSIPVLRLPPLARAIYFSTEIKHEIPQGLYVAVAQVLAYIYQLKRRDSLDDYEVTPDKLKDIPIPEELFIPEEDNE